MIHNQVLFVVLAAFLAVVSAQNLQTCVTSYDSTRDYFPVKSTVQFAKNFALTYKLNYKVLTNTAGTAATYVLYQCGTPQPNATLFPTGTKFFSVPAKKVWAYGDPDVSYLEFLGLRTTISGADVAGITSACVMKRADLGQVIDISSKLSNSSDFAGNDVAFGSSAGFAPNVATSYFSDPGLKNRAEWLKFYAAFFNKEDVANNLTAVIFNNTDCLANFAAKNVKSGLVVAFASGSSQYGYTASGSTGYKKDAITFAGATPLAATRSFAAANLTDFLNYIQNVDVLIDESYFQSNPTADQVLANYGVTQADATKYKWISKIFREDRLIDAAYNLDWYDTSDVLADEVVADFMNALNSSFPAPSYQRVWLRNIYTETTTVITSAQCADATSTTLDDFSFDCLAYTARTTTTTTTTTTGSRTNNSNVVGMTISMLLVVLFSLLL